MDIEAPVEKIHSFKVLQNHPYQEMVDAPHSWLALEGYEYIPLIRGAAKGGVKQGVGCCIEEISRKICPPNIPLGYTICDGPPGEVQCILGWDLGGKYFWNGGDLIVCGECGPTHNLCTALTPLLNPFTHSTLVPSVGTTLLYTSINLLEFFFFQDWDRVVIVIVSKLS